MGNKGGFWNKVGSGVKKATNFATQTIGSVAPMFGPKGMAVSAGLNMANNMINPGEGKSTIQGISEGIDNYAQSNPNVGGSKYYNMYKGLQGGYNNYKQGGVNSVAKSFLGNKDLYRMTNPEQTPEGGSSRKRAIMDAGSQYLGKLFNK
jgi:hypothetical protein